MVISMSSILKRIDNFNIDLDIAFNRHVLRMNDDKNLTATLRTFGKGSPEIIDYILSKFNKSKCSCCDGKGYLDDSGALSWS